MVIYEVNISVCNETYDAYYAWLVTHIKKMLEFTGFKKADFGLIEKTDTDMKHLRISYTINSYADLENYFTHHASHMRAEGIKKFGDQFNATRRIILEPVFLLAK